jgi:hypothetical protein
MTVLKLCGKYSTECYRQTPVAQRALHIVSRIQDYGQEEEAMHKANMWHVPSFVTYNRRHMEMSMCWSKIMPRIINDNRRSRCLFFPLLLYLELVKLSSRK